MAPTFFFLLFIPFLVHSYEVTDRISHIEEDQESNGPTLILLSHGKVVKYFSQTKLNDELLDSARREKRLVKFNLEKNRLLRSFDILPFASRLERENTSWAFTYEPTILNSLDEAISIFKNLRRGSTSWSQCFNRAHIWAYESKNKYDLDSMKAFLFFTSKYIRRYDYEWWFHVSPYTLTQEEGEVKERVLDFRFSKTPLFMKSWTDLFMLNKASCPIVEKYSQYRQNQDQEDCYLIKTSMYYLQPLDLSNLEETGRERSKWNDYEIRRAYRNGFGRW